MHLSCRIPASKCGILKVSWGYASASSGLSSSSSYKCAYSTLLPQPCLASETVYVDCRSNGKVSLNIFQPAVKERTPPVILYIPTGLSLKTTWKLDDDRILSALLAASNAVIVRVNYRTGEAVHYPTPVHDVLAGYDYVKARFQSKASNTSMGQPRKSHHLFGVCGQLIGGSLAAMLALTESRLGEDRIGAAALNCPITDWVFPELLGDDVAPNLATDLDTTISKSRVDVQVLQKKRRRTTRTSWEIYKNIAQLPISSLLVARESLFRKPAHYFDPFASPTLFLRSPGVEVPGDPQERQTKTFDIEDDVLIKPSRTRKAHRAFPPTGSSLILPDMRISVGETNPLHDQAEELVKLLRRNIVKNVQARGAAQAMLERYSDEMPSHIERLDLAVAAAEQRIEYHLHSGSGLWGSHEQQKWLDEVWKVGAWFRKVLT